MDRQLMLINKERQGSFFSGLVLPEVRPQLQKKDVFLIGAVEDKTPVGAAVLRLHPEAGEILSIASAVQRRREKIGTALLWESVRTLRKLGSSGLYGYLLEEDRAAAALFQAFGMRPEKQSNVSYSCTLSQIQKLLPKSERTHTYPLEAVPSYLFSAYSSQALNGGMQAYSQALFAPKCSRVLLEDQKITACILLEQTPEGLSIGWLHSFSKEKNAVLYLLQDALQAAAGLPPDTHIRFLTNLPRVLRLAEKLLPGGAEWTETRWAIEYEYFRLLDPTTKVWEG